LAHSFGFRPVIGGSALTCPFLLCVIVHSVHPNLAALTYKKNCMFYVQTSVFWQIP